jgi:menaquinone-dependent protoporphyrinogen oxidase
LAAYDAFVIGSGVYNAHWLKTAAELVRRNHDLLAERPVWLFSSGPLGTGAEDAQGRDLSAADEPKKLPSSRRPSILGTIESSSGR